MTSMTQIWSKWPYPLPLTTPGWENVNAYQMKPGDLFQTYGGEETCMVVSRSPAVVPETWNIAYLTSGGDLQWFGQTHESFVVRRLTR